MELLTLTFVQYAFIGGIMMALLAGVLGPFVVQSRQAVASDMFAHVALAGIGAALLAGTSPWLGALPTLLLVSVLIWWLLETDSYSPDALAMFFLSGGLAIALALVHIARDTTFTFENYLFGSILTLTSTELVVIGMATTTVLVLISNFWYPLIGATGSPAHITPYRRTPELIRLLYFLILAIVVWIGIKTIGGLLIGALLVIPVLIVRAFCHSFLAVTVASTVTAVGATIAGLGLALYIDLPPSSLIIGVLLLLFILSSLVQTIRSQYHVK